MKNENKRNQDKPSKKNSDKDQDKRYPNPDDPNEQTGPPIKEMPTKGGPHHEETLVHTPKNVMPLKTEYGSFKRTTT